MTKHTIDRSKSVGFTIVRAVNKLLFSLGFRSNINVQFLIAKKLLPKADNSVIVPTIYGFNIEVDPGADLGSNLPQSVDRNIYYLGTYEPATLSFIKQHLGVAGVFIDVGSYDGLMSLFASCVCKAAVVHAFEPIEDSYNRLVRNSELNNTKNIVPHKIALGDKIAQKKIYRDKRSDAMSSLVTSDLLIKDSQVVKVDTLDSMVQKLKLNRVDMVKIDTEGYEQKVIRGGEVTIRKYQPTLIVEYDPKRADSKKLYDYILGLDLYDIYVSENGRHFKGNIVRIIDFADIPSSLVTNLLCLKK